MSLETVWRVSSSSWLFNLIVSRLIDNAKDTPGIMRRKTLLALTAVANIITSALYLLIILVDSTFIYTVGYYFKGLLLIVSIACYAHVWRYKRLRSRHMALIMYIFYGISSAIAGFDNQPNETSYTYAFVSIMTLGYIKPLHNWISTFLICSGLIMADVAVILLAHDPPTPKAGTFAGRMTAFLFHLIFYLLVQLSSLYMDRTLLQCRDDARKVIRIANDFFSSLSEMDLEGADRALKDIPNDIQFPQCLRTHLDKMIKDLHVYRGYLPAALLEDIKRGRALLEHVRHKAPAVDLKDQRPLYAAVLTVRLAPYLESAAWVAAIRETATIVSPMRGTIESVSHDLIIVTFSPPEKAPSRREERKAWAFAIDEEEEAYEDEANNSDDGAMEDVIWERVAAHAGMEIDHRFEVLGIRDFCIVVTAGIVVRDYISTQSNLIDSGSGVVNPSGQRFVVISGDPISEGEELSVLFHVNPSSNVLVAASAARAMIDYTLPCLEVTSTLEDTFGEYLMRSLFKPGELAKEPMASSIQRLSAFQNIFTDSHCFNSCNRLLPLQEDEPYDHELAAAHDNDKVKKANGGETEPRPRRFLFQYYSHFNEMSAYSLSWLKEAFNFLRNGELSAAQSLLVQIVKHLETEQIINPTVDTRFMEELGFIKEYSLILEDIMANDSALSHYFKSYYRRYQEEQLSTVLQYVDNNSGEIPNLCAVCFKPIVKNNCDAPTSPSQFSLLRPPPPPLVTYGINGPIPDVMPIRRWSSFSTDGAIKDISLAPPSPPGNTPVNSSICAGCGRRASDTIVTAPYRPKPLLPPPDPLHVVGLVLRTYGRFPLAVVHDGPWRYPGRSRALRWAGYTEPLRGVAPLIRIGSHLLETTGPITTDESDAALLAETVARRKQNVVVAEEDALFPVLITEEEAEQQNPSNDVSMANNLMDSVGSGIKATPLGAGAFDAPGEPIPTGSMARYPGHDVSQGSASDANRGNFSPLGTNFNGPSTITDNNGGIWKLSRRVIGEGAFAMVRLAMSSHGRTVAVKIIDLDHRQVSATAKELVKEVGALSELRHENILSYLSWGLRGANLYIFTEWVSGGSLKSQMTNLGTRFPLSACREYFHSALNGLLFLHETAHIIHCDIKPANLLVHPDGRIMLGDFGSAMSCTSSTGHATSTDDDDDLPVVRGTSWYMAPEACRGMLHSASDIWSLAISFIELLIGRLPWSKEQMKSEYHFIVSLGKGLPPFNDKGMFGGFKRLIDFVRHTLREDGNSYYTDPFEFEDDSDDQEVEEDPILLPFCELLETCLRREPEQRPTAKQLLSNPFFYPNFQMNEF